MNNVFNNENINYLSTDPKMAEQIQQQQERMALAEAYRQNAMKAPAVRGKTARRVQGAGQMLSSLGKVLTDWNARKELENLRNQDKQARAEADNLQGIINRYDSGERPTQDYYDGSEAFNQTLGNMESQPQNYGYDPREGLVQSLVQQQGEMPQGRFNESSPLQTRQAQTLQDAMRMGGIDPDKLNYYQQQIMANRGQQQQALAQKIAEREANMQDFAMKEAIKAGYDEKADYRRADIAQQQAAQAQAAAQQLMEAKLGATAQAMANAPLDSKEQKLLFDEFAGYRDSAKQLMEMEREADALYNPKTGIFRPDNPETIGDQDDNSLTGWFKNKRDALWGDGTYTMNEGRARAFLSQFVMENVSKLKGALSDKDLVFIKETMGTLGENPNLQQVVKVGRLIAERLQKRKEELFGEVQSRYNSLEKHKPSQDYARSFLEGNDYFNPIINPVIDASNYGG